MVLGRKIKRSGLLLQKTTTTWIEGGKSDFRETQQEARVVELAREDSSFYRDIAMEIKGGVKVSLGGGIDKIW